MELYNTFYCLFLMLLLWLGNYAVYLTCNHGLAPNARIQQLFRYLVGAIVATVPLLITQTSPLQPIVWFALGVSFLWSITYPLIFHISNRKISQDYDHQIDSAFGIYLFGWLTGISLLPNGYLVVCVLSLLLLILPITQLVYYAMYRTVIDVNGMLLIQNTDYNEVIEFLRYYSFWKVLVVVLLVIALITCSLWLIISSPCMVGTFVLWRIAIVICIICFITYYLWKPKHGLFIRTGIAKLFNEVRDYTKKNQLYSKMRMERLESLDVVPKTTLPRPHTFLIVIGESASRDFMSAFSAVEEDTTPWLKELSHDINHCTLFHNAYSCDIQTVPTLERALSSFNQYEEGSFYTASSIIDIASQLGYNIHWYSNQGQLGVADTPITLIANTANVTKWTKQEIGKLQYDEALIDFLDELDSTKNNLVFLHLMGSHFNYENRFTEEKRQWGSVNNHNKITNYKNTLYYTDSVLKKAFEETNKRFNLQTMVYFSDHADVPDRHRQPNFGGFRDIRIPLMVWLGDDYLKTRPHRVTPLRQHKDSYWTNDLLFDLICGLMDVESSTFHEEHSLASYAYRFKRENLTAMDGKIKIEDDPYNIK